MNAAFNQITTVLERSEIVEAAVLIGSRANGQADATSDWDVAVLFAKPANSELPFARVETLRRSIAQALNVSETVIDVIDLDSAGLSMRRTASEGVLLFGESSLTWCKFLQRVWRELDEFYWDTQRAA